MKETQRGSDRTLAARASGVRGSRTAGPRGKSLVEVLAVLVLLSLLIGIGGPSIERAVMLGRLRAASRELTMLFRQMRMEAVLAGRTIGVVFEADGGWSYAVYRDGNGNGIRRVDVERGVDVRLQGPFRLEERFPGVRIAILVPGPIPVIPPERGRLENLEDPVKFGPSNIVSCTAAGSCSYGTVYLSAGRRRLAAVRMMGAIGKVRLWEYEPRRGWEHR